MISLLSLHFCLNFKINLDPDLHVSLSSSMFRSQCVVPDLNRYDRLDHIHIPRADFEETPSSHPPTSPPTSHQVDLYRFVSCAAPARLHLVHVHRERRQASVVLPPMIHGLHHHCGYRRTPPLPPGSGSRRPEHGIVERFPLAACLLDCFCKLAYMFACFCLLASACLLTRKKRSSYRACDCDCDCHW
jgi:hypothetical protein